MKIVIEIYDRRRDSEEIALLNEIHSQLKRISNKMATKEQLTAAFDRIQAAQANIAGDIRDLKDSLENAGVDQELVDRAEAIATSLEGLAAENPETPDEPTPINPDEA